MALMYWAKGGVCSISHPAESTGVVSGTHIMEEEEHMMYGHPQGALEEHPLMAFY